MCSTLRQTRHGACLVALLLTGAIPSVASAAWDNVPEVNLSASTSDNVLRTQQGEQSGSWTVLDARLTTTYFDERANLYIAPRVVVDAYADSQFEPLETEDYFLRAGGQYRWQTVTGGFRIDYSDRNVLRAEFEDAVPGDPDIDDPALGDTGRVGFAEQKREYYFIGGNLDFNLSERDVLRVDLTGSEAAYSVSSSPNRTGYDYNEAALEYARQVNDRSGFFVGASVGDYTAASNDNNTDTVGVYAGFARDLSQAWRLNLSAGANTLDYDFIAGTTRIADSATAPAFGIGLRKRNERSVWNFDLEYMLNPSSSGYLTENARARVFLRQQFSPRFAGRFGVLLTSSTPSDDLDAQNERDYARLQVSFEWAMSRTMLLTFGFDSLRQEFPNENSGATNSTNAFVGVTYRGLSRQNQ
ncbi:MAG TPA: hypothetical protein VLD39_11010 [Gammaproteobacteria bacterium]|nr:hypothetical protein [Gammaproteobacteria bacterium]